MNAGFSSLTALKAQLLAEALRAGTKYDTVLMTLGLGVAAQCEKFCNRKFSRIPGALFYCTADRDHCFVDRYPIESVSAVAMQSDPTSGYEELSGAVLNWEAASGLISFGSRLGNWNQTVRVTFTGGYWWDITEDASDSLPTNATAVPDDLKLAWLTQCRLVWQAMDKLGVDVVRTGSASGVNNTIGTVALSDGVKETLLAYRRYQIS